MGGGRGKTVGRSGSESALRGKIFGSCEGKGDLFSLHSSSKLSPLLALPLLPVTNYLCFRGRTPSYSGGSFPLRRRRSCLLTSSGPQASRSLFHRSLSYVPAFVKSELLLDLISRVASPSQRGKKRTKQRRERFAAPETNDGRATERRRLGSCGRDGTCSRVSVHAVPRF